MELGSPRPFTDGTRRQMSVEKAGSAPQISSANLKAAAKLRAGGPYREGLSSPEGIKNAFEALLLGQILKPMQESLQRSGSIPKGAAGDIYSHFWQTHLSSLLAKQIDIAPGWNPAVSVETAPGDTIQSFNGQTKEGIKLERHRQPGSLINSAAPVRSLGEENRRLEPPAGLFPPTGLFPPVGHSREQKRSPMSKQVGQIPARLQPSARALAPFEKAIESAAADSGIDSNWVRAVIMQESSGKVDAVSNRGAQGLMQLMPTTAAALGVSDSFNGAENIAGGTRYLGKLMQRFGDPRLALAAYNAGPTRVERYGAVPPIRETQKYVSEVMAKKQDFDWIWPAADAGAGSE